MKHRPRTFTGSFNQEASMEPKHFKILVQSGYKGIDYVNGKKVFLCIIFTRTAFHRDLKRGTDKAKRSVDQTLSKRIAFA